MSSKPKIAFFCSNCGHESPKWLGKCPLCYEWNSFVEEVISKESKAAQGLADVTGIDLKETKQAISIDEIVFEKEKRYITPDVEFNRVLGGGIVKGSLVLIGGEPGIGKSTLLLQIGLQLKDQRILYISGEESEQQIKMRAERIAFKNAEFFVLAETKTQKIFHQIKNVKPDFVIIDSIQTTASNLIDSPAGSVSQTRQCASEFQCYAKEFNIPIILVGHITKDGNIAGPKVLEHIVDTVIIFEGDQHYNYRLLRTIKNRFGSSGELGIYEMNQHGLRPVLNPAELLLAQKDHDLSGTTIAASLEGLRPLLIETQALVTPAVYGMPQRTVTGYDAKRLSILLAVLEKRGGFLFGNKDVFVNIAGGLKIEDPALDLAVVCALLSSFQDQSVSAKYCFAGEVGLNGEIRAVNKIETRISEAEKLGFEKIFISKYNSFQAKKESSHIEVVSLTKVSELHHYLFKI